MIPKSREGCLESGGQQAYHTRTTVEGDAIVYGRRSEKDGRGPEVVITHRVNRSLK